MLKNSKRIVFSVVIILLIVGAPGFANGQMLTEGALKQRKQGDPLANLPQHIQVLTQFGERADISPGNDKVAFMAKIFGDAMVIDIKTRQISCLTCNIPAAAFLRVMHLYDGNYLLTGPEHFENPQLSRKNADLWFLNKLAGSKPLKLGLQLNEGMAISKQSYKIAYTQWTDEGTQLLTADIDLSGALPRLMNQKVILKHPGKECTLEAQDFYDKDTKLTFFCYVPDGTFEVQGIDLLTGKVTNFSRAPGSFNEPEGIFPDGYTAVESDRQCDSLGGKRGSANIDIWKLKLDGTGKDFVRLTHFNDYEGGKAANPVVATNGKFMSFQVAKSTDPPGIGHGLLLYWFAK
jgi:hypothetical protein